MPFLMHIAFDNSRRLERRVYYLEYRGVRFKLIQNDPRKWSDVLLTLVPSHDRAGQQQAYTAAAEFLSALAWQNGSRVTLENAGGMGVPEGYTLRQARCRIFTFPQIPFGGHVRGFGLSVIPHIETDAQRVALTLFREARSSNKVWLSFLFYWQVMEVGGDDPVTWINRVYYKQSKVHVRQEDLRKLPLRGRRLGEYLQEDCRHAIAHIRRKPGGTPLQFDVGDENLRLAISSRVVEQFAEHYIRAVLALSKRLHLVRSRGRGFPRYVDQATMRSRYLVPAYRG
jgi:hypothetical protein